MEYANRVDFTGQPIYIGMDVHKKSWTVSIFLEHLEHKTFTQPPMVAPLVSYLHRHFPGACYRAVYEAGYCGFWIHDQLRENGIACMVTNPADVPTRDKERRRKGDRSDSRKLARTLRSGQLEGIHVPTRARVEDRGLVRTRQAMVRKQTRCKNQIKSLLFLYGLPVPDAGSSWSRNFLRSLEALRFERDSGNLALKAYLTELMQLRQIIAQLNRDLRALSRTDEYREGVQLLKSVPGISTLSAMVFLTDSESSLGLPPSTSSAATWGSPLTLTAAGKNRGSATSRDDATRCFVPCSSNARGRRCGRTRPWLWLITAIVKERVKPKRSSRLPVSY